MSKATILVIDDEANLRTLLARIVSLEGYTVFEAPNAKAGLRVLATEAVHVVVSDVRLPDGNGVELTATIKAQFPLVEIIVLTAFGTIEDGVRAIKNGAFDYLTKGDHQDRILPLLSKASDKALLQQKVLELENKLTERHGFATIIGTSRALQQAIVLAKKVAPSDTTVLLLGETGVGKEVFAQAIHTESNRRSGPIVALNCSAFPKDLLESEMFGHAEGSFTGATKAKKGLIEEANGGTLFLDEIGEMSLDVQAKFLRVIETGEFYRVGDTKKRKIDIRIIAATNRDLEAESEAGRFRKDLFYRLSVFVINIPSLRERTEDIERLALYYLKYFSLKTNRAVPRITPSFLQALKAHSWKGNIRELKNVIERCVILADDALDTGLLPAEFTTRSDNDAFDLATIEKNHIKKVLHHTDGNKTQAAKLLDIGLTTLYQKIKDYNL